jgi:acetylornithine deacetylase/succinyl-diaminopimelate desuccinylase family protein
MAPNDLHALIDRDRVIERTLTMVQIPSVNPFESARLGPIEGEVLLADWLVDQLDLLGYKPTRHEVAPGRPNVWGIGPGGDGPIVMLGGHLDTVGVEGYSGDPFSGDLRDGRLYGRGSCDMKGAFACFLEVAEVLASADQKFPGRVMIAGIADEEAAMLGSTEFPSHGPAADFAIIGEPTELSICTAHLGQYAVPIRTFGRAVHSSIASEGLNAIEQMMKVITALGEYRDELHSRPGHDMCGSGSVNAGVIRGGNMVSIVPDLCQLEVDRRVSPLQTSAEVRGELVELLESIAAHDHSFAWELGSPLVDSGPLDTPLDSPVVLAAQSAARRNETPDVAVAFSASTDAPNLGVPAIIWGPGSLSQAHTIDEFVEVDQLETATHLYLDAVLELIG